MPQGNPKAGELYLHFKNKRYEIKGLAIHSETREKMVIYQALYGDYGTYVRPYDMFVSQVDHTKYPEVSQQYRFAYVGMAGESSFTDQSMAQNTNQSVLQNTIRNTAETVTCTSTEAPQPENQEECVNPNLLAFLDAETFDEKYRLVRDMELMITDRLVDNLAAALDLVIPEGTLDYRYAQLKSAVATRARYETTRLR